MATEIQRRLIDGFSRGDDADDDCILVLLNLGDNSMVKIGPKKALLEIRGRECELVDPESLAYKKWTLKTL